MIRQLQIIFSLNKINFNKCKIKLNGINYLSKTLINHKNLKSLSLSSNIIGLKGLQYLNKVFYNNSELSLLDLSKSEIDK